MDTAHLSIAEAAKRLRVNPRTVRRHIKAGKLPADKQEYPGGFQYVIPASEVDKLLAQSTDIVPVAAHRLDKTIDRLESMSNMLDTVQDNVHGAVQGIVNPIVQAQERQTEEIKGLRAELRELAGLLQQPPKRSLWQRFFKGGN